MDFKEALKNYLEENIKYYEDYEAFDERDEIGQITALSILRTIQDLLEDFEGDEDVEM